MKTIKVRFRVTFEAMIQVKDNAKMDDIMDEVSKIDIPENDICSYIPDSFEAEGVIDSDPLGLNGDVCDECGSMIPNKSGGTLENKRHAESCSLYDADKS